MELFSAVVLKNTAYTRRIVFYDMIPQSVVDSIVQAQDVINFNKIILDTCMHF